MPKVKIEQGKMVLNTMEQYRKVQEIWKWSKKLREITESDDLDLVKNNLLEECYSVCAAPLPSFEEQCFFSIDRNKNHC